MPVEQRRIMPTTYHKVTAHNQHNLQHGKHKLHLPVDADEQHIGDDEECAKEHDPHGRRDARVPERHDDRRGRELRREGDEPGQQRVPALRKGQGRVYKDLGMADDASAEGNECTERSLSDGCIQYIMMMGWLRSGSAFELTSAQL